MSSGDKFKGRVCIIMKDPKGDCGLDKFKYAVPEEMNIGQFMLVLRKHMIKINAEQAVFLFISKENRLVSVGESVSDLRQYADKDGNVQVTCALENTFGTPESPRRASPKPIVTEILPNIKPSYEVDVLHFNLLKKFPLGIWFYLQKAEYILEVSYIYRGQNCIYNGSIDTSDSTSLEHKIARAIRRHINAEEGHKLEINFASLTL